MARLVWQPEVPNHLDRPDAGVPDASLRQWEGAIPRHDGRTAPATLAAPGSATSPGRQRPGRLGGAEASL